MNSDLKLAGMDRVGEVVEEFGAIGKPVPGQILTDAVPDMNVVISGLNDLLWAAQERITELEAGSAPVALVDRNAVSQPAVPQESAQWMATFRKNVDAHYSAPSVQDAPSDEQCQQPEVVEYQRRVRPVWRTEWSEWERCTAAAYADYLKVPLLNDPRHEVRAALCVAAPVSGEVVASRKQLDLRVMFEQEVADRHRPEVARGLSLKNPDGSFQVSSIEMEYRAWVNGFRKAENLLGEKQ